MELNKDLIYQNANGNSDIVAISIFLKYGTLDESKKGVTNLLTSLLGKKTKSKTISEINETFESVGGYLSFKTFSDFILISINTKIKKLKDGIDVLLEVLTEPIFEDDMLKTEKEQVLSTISSRKEKPYDFAFDNLRKLVYKNTPYEISSIGEEDTVKNISLEDIYNRYEEIKQKQILVSVTADNLKDSDLEKIASIQNLFTINPKNHEIAFCNKIKENEVKYIERGGFQSTILCGYDAPLTKYKDEYFAFKILNTILGNGMSSILFKTLREEKGYAYAVSSSYSVNLYCSKLFTYIGTAIEKAQNALTDLTNTIANLYITDEHIELAKQKLIGNFLLEHQTRQSKSYTAGYYELLGIGKEVMDKYEEFIFAVQKEDIINIYNKYIKNYQCIVVK